MSELFLIFPLCTLITVEWMGDDTLLTKSLPISDFIHAISFFFYGLFVHISPPFVKVKLGGFRPAQASPDVHVHHYGSLESRHIDHPEVVIKVVHD